MTNASEHPVEWLPEFALGVLSEGEAEAIRTHVEHCDACRAEFERMAAVSRLLPLAAETQAPDRQVRDRLIERVRTEPASVAMRTGNRRWMRLAAVAAAIVLLVGTGGFLAGRFTAGGADDELAERQDAIVLAAAHGTLRVSHGTSETASVSVVRAPTANAGFAFVQGLPALDEGKAYQAWFSADGQRFEPSDVFTVHDGGVWLTAESPMEQYVAMALTIEDASGVDAPTQAPFVVVPLATTAAAR